jgi:hypothetical protein
MTPTTKLEAVNIMLSSIGEAPVNSLTSGLVDAEMAETILNAVSRDVQSQGWHFNTEIDFTIAPNLTTGEINVPANTLRIDTTGEDSGLDLVMRGKRLYDRKNHTFKINKSIKLEMVVMLAFEEMPEAARRYCTLKSARMFQDRVVGSTDLHGFQERDEVFALVELKDAESMTADHNIFDNYGVTRILDRSIS